MLTRFVAASVLLALVATMQAMASSRRADAPVWQVDLCTDDGIVTVALDADGRRVPTPHVCPDCLVFFGALPDAPPDAVRMLALHAQGLSAIRPLHHISCPAPARFARAPPLVSDVTT